MTAPASFKTMIQSGTIRRADAMKVRYADIHVEDGFNLRDHDEEFEQGIEELTAYIMGGGYVPPMEVRPRPAGDGVIVVDGHRRHIAIGRAIKQGAPIELVAVVGFAGNDVERVTRIMTSNEGVKLRPLEVAAGYKRLAAFDLSADDIAAKVNKTRQHVEQMLILANANADVHALVKSGAVSAAVAIDTVRKLGEKAGAFLAAKYGEAQASGKSKVTAGAIRGKAFSREIVSGLVIGVDEFMCSLTKLDRDRLAKITAGELDSYEMIIEGAVLVRLLSAHGELQAVREKQEQKAAKKGTPCEV